MNTVPEWHLTGDWFDICSCNIPCPREFAQAPTNNACAGMLAWHARQGHSMFHSMVSICWVSPFRSFQSVGTVVISEVGDTYDGLTRRGQPFAYDEREARPIDPRGAALV